MKKTIHDMLDLYAMKHQSTDMFLMLKDYPLDARLNRDELNTQIMLSLGERQTYWQHTELLKANIDNWFTNHADNIKKLVDTIELEYNPLYNTDYYEKVDNKKKTDNKRVEDLDTHYKPDSTVTSENEVSAYDASGYQPQDKNTTHSTGDDQTKGDNTITDDNKTIDDNLLHHYGKEGTETYADLINEERRLAEFNVYDWIVNQLDSEICLGVF